MWSKFFKQTKKAMKCIGMLQVIQSENESKSITWWNELSVIKLELFTSNKQPHHYNYCYTLKTKTTKKIAIYVTFKTCWFFLIGAGS